jgi:SLOG cluster2
VTDSRSAPTKELLRRIVAGGLATLQGEIGGASSVGSGRDVFTCFSRQERLHVDGITELITSYLARGDARRPLCIAVFAAPGSGKSSAVRAIAAQLYAKKDGATSAQSGSDGTKKLAPLGRLKELNLTQIASPAALAEQVEREAHRAASADAPYVPFIFFDEFDGPLDGAGWGWLSWFLAPMQDGAFLSEWRTVSLRKAVYVFAGGTATTFEEFEYLGRRDRAGFVRAKGPDFISRLRGYIDLEGLNTRDESRLIRRADALHWNLKGRPINDGLVFELLHAGRYKHGKRSMEAIFDMMAPVEKGAQLTAAHLPLQHLLEMHQDAGPLDWETIGGSIALAGGDDGPVAAVWPALAEKLWMEGARVAFAGAKQDKGDVETRLGQLAEELPRRLRGRDFDADKAHVDAKEWKPIVHYVWGERGAGTAAGAAAHGTEGYRVRELEFLDWSTTPEEQREAIGWFRMRQMITFECVARVVMGGSTRTATSAFPQGYVGRLPSAVEGILFSLAVNQPIYVAGHWKGAAAWAGGLLGLGEPRDDADMEELLEQMATKNPPPFFQSSTPEQLPASGHAVKRFLTRHALGGEGWPDNGLTPQENRDLFEVEDVKDVCDLVLKGLRRRFADAT